MRLVLLFILLMPISTSAGESAAAFFESKIRPVLVEHCYPCHAGVDAKLKGGLRLDSRAGLLKGGENGAIVIPGKPDKSAIIVALHHDDPATAMPPKKKLPANIIADFEAWVTAGAVDPRTEVVVAVNDPTRHWAFQPIARTPSSPGNPVDRHIRALLEAKGLKPSPMADRRTLLRRVTFDLIGLPPTMSEMEAFENDHSADAYAKVVERLLASPRYGEKWARHWLDVARYADTKDGVLMFGADRIRPFAYTYRDYVIRAFNDDLPYDQFIHDQLAADQVTPALPSWRLAGLGLLTLGRGFDGNVHDVIDDQIDVVTRGLLGLTVACARCHDHKYDPVPTADYYALHGIFAAAETPLRLPMIDATAKGPESYEKQYADQLARIEKTLDSQYAMLLESTRSRAAEYLLHVATTPADPLETAVFLPIV